MTPERMADLVARWVRFYTRDVPRPIAERRIEEIDADLHDHITDQRAAAAGDRRIAFSIAARMLRGLPADASWRAHTIARSSTAKEVKMSRTSYARVGLVTALILLIPLVANQFTDGEGWSVADFVTAGVLLAGTGMLLELAARKPGNIGLRVVAGAIALAAIVFGQADDAPGLVLFGCLLILGTVALSFRRTA